MGVAVVVCVIGLAAVLVVLYRDAPPVDTAVAARAPAWGALPRAEDVTAVRFPVSPLGYHRGMVDQHVRSLAAAYTDLLAVAPDDVVRRARARAEARTGDARDTGGKR